MRPGEDSTTHSADWRAAANLTTPQKCFVGFSNPRRETLCLRLLTHSLRIMPLVIGKTCRIKKSLVSYRGWHSSIGAVVSEVAVQRNWKTLSRSEFVELMERYPAKKVADMCGVTFAAVYHRARTDGIPLRGHVDIRKPTGPTRRFHPPKDELADLFRRMSMKQIAEHYGVGETAVHKRIHEYGLNGPGRAARMSAYAKVRPDEHNRKIAESLSKRTGPLAANWQGGVTQLDKLARSGLDYRRWKAAVLARDGFRCAECGIEQGYVCPDCRHRVILHAHHIVPFSENPGIRFTLDNGITLCKPCHEKAHHSKSGELLGTPESLDATA